MDPTSRNRVLMIGGALIVIALLLVCGPLQDRLGSGGSGTALPPVAAGPPETLNESAAEPAPTPLAPAARIDAATSEAGSAAEEPSETSAVAVVPVPPAPAAGAASETAAAAAVTSAAAGAAAAGASAVETETAASAPTSAASATPPVSPPPPASPTAAAVFDDVLAASSLGSARDGLGVGPAGPVSRRFAPPVASGGPMALGIQAAQQFGIDSSLLRPCDTPGSGCQNLVSAAVRPNPPIRPGVRPVPPPNLPIQPGPRPTP